MAKRGDVVPREPQGILPSLKMLTYYPSHAWALGRGQHSATIVQHGVCEPGHKNNIFSGKSNQCLLIYSHDKH